LRLITPWLLLAAWGLSFSLAGLPFYAILFAGQTLLLGIGAGALLSPSIRRIRPLGIIAAVFALNFACWLAFWVWLCGSTKRTWKKVEYGKAEPTSAP
jgi:hypothetical protein